MENAEYLKQKKKKKKGRKIFWLISILVLIAVAAGIFFYQKQKKEAEETDPNARENVVLEENQSWQSLQIENIVGNEIEAVDGAFYTIPVGTEVVTKLGSVTTFSRLAQGDTICCLMQEDAGEAVILKIWIEE